MGASPSSRRFQSDLAGLRSTSGELLHVDDFAVAGSVEVGKPSFLDKTHALIEAARRRIAVGRRSIDIDVLGAGLAHGGFGAGIDVSAKAPTLLLGRNYDPVKIERTLGALDHTV